MAPKCYNFEAFHIVLLEILTPESLPIFTASQAATSSPSTLSSLQTTANRGSEQNQQQQQQAISVVEQGSNALNIWVDGSFKGGCGGCGVAYFNLTTQQWEGVAVALGQPPDITCSQDAEFWGLHEGLHVAKELLDETPAGSSRRVNTITVFTDNEMVAQVYGLTRSFASRPKSVRTWGPIEEIDHIKEDFRNKYGIMVTTEWVQAHNGDPGNEHADKLAKFGADMAKLDPDDGTMPWHMWNPAI